MLLFPLIILLVVLFAAYLIIHAIPSIPGWFVRILDILLAAIGIIEVLRFLFTEVNFSSWHF